LTLSLTRMRNPSTCVRALTLEKNARSTVLLMVR
jgi:hypothetical protein